MQSGKDDTIFDLFIIGGGPASLTAAIYATRACLKTAFIEKEYPGGKLNKTQSIENYPGYLENTGADLAEKMLKQALENEVQQFWGEVIDIKKEGKEWRIYTKDTSYISKTVLIASGMKERVLDIPNVKEYYGKGVSYCAICDGNLYKGKDIVVVGGGNSAVEEAIYLSDITSKVNLVHRRNEFRADAVSVKKMKSINNIIVNTPYIPKEVKVENEKVRGLVIKGEEEKLIEGDCVFFYVGLIPESSFLSSLNLERDEAGFIKVDENMRTSQEGLYAAGDIISKNLRQVVTAISDGATAAIAIKNYLNALDESI